MASWKIPPLEVSSWEAHLQARAIFQPCWGRGYMGMYPHPLWGPQRAQEWHDGEFTMIHHEKKLGYQISRQTLGISCGCGGRMGVE